MQEIGVLSLWGWLNTLRKRRAVQSALSVGLSLAAPLLIFLTYYVLSRPAGALSDRVIGGILLADFVYILVVATLIALRVVGVILSLIHI